MPSMMNDESKNASTPSAASFADEGPTGVLITFEGGDGVGKSTHIAFLVEQLRAAGFEVLQLREPGGTAVGEQLRSIVLDPANADLCDEAELLIYEAARAQIVAQVIKPALERGAVVVCDRFADSTIAYQGFGRGLSIDAVTAANAFACQGVIPDRTILMVAKSPEEGLERVRAEREADRLEQAGAAFHERVSQGFLRLAAQDPDRIRTVVSTGLKSDTARAVFREVRDLFPAIDERAIDFQALDGR